MFAGPLSDEKVREEGDRARFKIRGWKIRGNAEKVLFWKMSEDRNIFSKPIEASQQDLATPIGG
jgi:hypothetical protein